MPDDISLLPEHLRKKEEELKKPEKSSETKPELKFSNPVEEKEDVEVIEVDEGEIDKVLASEPWLSRLAYQATNAIDALRHKLFEPNVPPPPPKLPPQFFVPPADKPIAVPPSPAEAAGLGTASAPVENAVSNASKSKVRIIPSETAPRRVRVIRRVRKPVQVSFVSPEDVRLQHIDVPKRRFTLVIAVFFFLLLLGGGYTLLQNQLHRAEENLHTATQKTADIRKKISEKQGSWTTFQDLEPRLRTLGVLLDQHVSPTHVLGLIEQTTLPTVSYGSFNLTADGRVALSVIADSIEAAAGQIIAFQKSGFVTKVDASSYAILYDSANPTRPQSVTFQLGLTLTEKALRPNALVLSH